MSVVDERGEVEAFTGKRSSVAHKARGIPASVAEALVSPSRSVAPYTSEVSLAVGEGSEPRMYPFYVVIHDHTKGQCIIKCESNSQFQRYRIVEGSPIQT